MNDQDQINEEERHEAATETPINGAAGVRALPHFPSGADGTEPEPKKRSEVEKLNEILFERLGEIERKCCAVRSECDAKAFEDDASETNIKLVGAFSELRQMCDFYKPREKPIDPTAPEMERGKGRLFKSKHISSCHGTYIYDYVCINDAHIRASLHYDNGGLEQHTTIWLCEGERCFCYATFNTCSAVKCDYIVRGMIAGLAKRLVYHHKNLIKRKAKWAAAKAAKKGGAK